MSVLHLVFAIVIIIAVFYIIAGMRRAPRKKPRHLMTFTITITPQEALKAVIDFALQTGYEIDDFAETEGRIILSDSISLTSWGFFYPIYVSKNGDGSTLIEVGIKSKAPIAGTIALRHQERCFNGVKAFIFGKGYFNIAQR